MEDVQSDSPVGFTPTQVILEEWPVSEMAGVFMSPSMSQPMQGLFSYPENKNRPEEENATAIYITVG